MATGEALRLRREAGKWLQDLREANGLSQRDLAKVLGTRFYTFISQIENGRGRVPPGQAAVWAKTLKVPARDFAITLMKYYDPVNYDLIFGDETVLPRSSAIVPQPEAEVVELQARVSKLEARIDKLDRQLRRRR